MESVKLMASVLAVLISVASFIFAWRADVRSKKAEAIKNLLGEKETVAFAALKLLQDGFPPDPAERKLAISAVMQACLLEGSDRARALLYQVIDKHRAVHGNEFEEALCSIKNTFNSMASFKFSNDELDLRRGKIRIGAVEKVVANDHMPSKPLELTKS